MLNRKNGVSLKRRQELYFPVLLTLLDLACIACGLLLAYGFRFWFLPIIRPLAPFIPVTGGHLPSDYVRLFPLSVLSFSVAFSFVHLYRANAKVWGWQTAGRLARGTLLAMAIFITITFFFRSLTVYPLARWMIPISMVTVPILVALERHFLQREMLRRAHRSGKGLARALVVGVGPTAREVSRSIRRHPEFGWTVVGFLSADSSDIGLQQAGAVVLGTVQDLARVLEAESIEAVFVAQPDFRHEMLGEVFIECQKRMVDVKVVPDVTELLFSQISTEVVDGIPFLGLCSTPLQGWNAMLKRGLDLCVSGLLLAVLSPFIALIAWLVRMDSWGPVFFRQERVGADGKRFFLWKFRTMKTDAESTTGPVFASPDDPRQTRVGRVLRQLHLDELPQLLNVFLGDMSLVGPRPERPHFVEQFREEIPRYMARHRIKSGLTGWAQVNGQSGFEGTISERLKYDLYYIENWSVFFDLKVLVLTFVWLSRRLHQLLTLPPDHPSLRKSEPPLFDVSEGSPEISEREEGEDESDSVESSAAGFPRSVPPR